MHCSMRVLIEGGVSLVWKLVFLVSGPQVVLDCPELRESSGVCFARSGDAIWTHNDSGDGAVVYAFRRDGSLLGRAAVEDARAVDWEDICSFTHAGSPFLAIADVGDNQRRRSSVQIYVVREPALADFADRNEIKAQVAGVLHVRYPDGPVDCESIAYDPKHKVFLLATKELLRCRLFEVDASEVEGKRDVVAKEIGRLVLPLITGADISRDGNRLVLATYGPGCMVYREGDQWQLGPATQVQAFDLPSRKQGESICFDAKGENLYLTSEFVPTPLLSIPCPSPPDD